MSSKVMLVGGLASLLTIPIWILVVILVPDFNFEKAPAGAYAALFAGSIATMVTFAGMYYLFSARSPLNALLLALGVVGVALTLIPSDGSWTYNLGSFGWGGALLVAGYLLRGSHSIWLSWLGIVSGVLFILIGVTGLAGQQDLANVLNGISSVPILVWAVWIGWVMIKESRSRTA